MVDIENMLIFVIGTIFVFKMNKVMTKALNPENNPQSPNPNPNRNRNSPEQQARALNQTYSPIATIRGSQEYQIFTK